jgi:DnaJ-class molecular chaperone
MQNHYKTLGLTNAATVAEIRRAYRILARRYHPDLNPRRDSEELFKEIAKAYEILSDAEKRAQHDLELDRAAESLSETFDRAHEAFRRNQQKQAYAKAQRDAPKSEKPKQEQPKPKPQPSAKTQEQRKHSPTPRRKRRALDYLSRIAQESRTKLATIQDQFLSRKRSDPAKPAHSLSQLSLIEASVSIHDAIQGTRRTVEIPDGTAAPRKISVQIPAGVRTGSIIRFRRKEDPSEEIVVVVQVEHHPWLSITERGITMEIPLTVSEAIEGGKIQVPSLGDPLLVTVEPGTQSGREVRLKGQGITHRDGTRGDLFIRFQVKIPTGSAGDELTAKARALAPNYAHPVRAHLPKSILEV